jgi:hypothetical protein
MLARYLVAGVAGSLLLASSAFAAEDTTAKTPAPATSAAATNTSFHGDWRTSKVVGLKAAVISVGGCLGMGSRLIALPLDKVKFSETPVPSATANAAPATGGNRPASTTTGSTATTTAKTNPWYPDHAMISGSKDQLKSMPEFKFE